MAREVELVDDDDDDEETLSTSPAAHSESQTKETLTGLQKTVKHNMFNLGVSSPDHAG